MVEQRSIAERSVEWARQMQHAQHQEILELRKLFKQSMKDQRDWFELQLDYNRILAITPATMDSARVTVDTVRRAETTTGLDGSRLRHLIEPIPQLRLKRQGMQVDE